MTECSASDQGSLPHPLWVLEKPPKALAEFPGESPPFPVPWPGGAPPCSQELGAQPQEAPGSAPSY